jgi:hypothetical protein
MGFYFLHLADSFVFCSQVCVQLTSGVSCDRNFFTVSDGFVTDCFKGNSFCFFLSLVITFFSFVSFFSLLVGLPDEVHNGLLATYQLHKQEHKLFQEKGDSAVSEEYPLSTLRMIRCVPLKVYAAVVAV